MFRNIIGIGVTPRRETEIVSLQYVRAFAALAVVFFHAEIQVNDVFSLGRYELPLTGRFGVDLFFVLSGFVMWISSGKKAIRPGQFMARRIARIVPLYWMVTLAAAFVSLAIPTLLRSTVFDVPTIFTSLLFVPWPNPAVPPQLTENLVPFIVPGWTLNFEMFFYVIFAAALWSPVHRRIPMLCLAAIAATAAAYFLSDIWEPARFYLQTLILEFLAGVFIAWKIFGRDAAPLAVCKVLLIVCIAALVLFDIDPPRYDRSLYLGVPAAIVVICAITLERAGRVPYINILDKLGNASYSIYLTHIFVISGARVLAKLTGFLIDSPAQGFVFVILCLAVSALAGLVMHKYVEIPLVRLTQAALSGLDNRLRRVV